MIICLEHLSNKENLMLMKNLFPSRVIVCVITLLTLTFPVFAQTTNATDEYEETLKKMMKLSGASAATDDLYPKMLSVMKLNAPGKDDAYWNDFAKDWKEKIENRVIELCMPAYKKHLTLEDLKAIAAFYESPVGRKYKESSLAVIREAMEERKKGVRVLVAQMNKNKKFQKEQLGKEGYQEFKEFYKESLKH